MQKIIQRKNKTQSIIIVSLSIMLVVLLTITVTYAFFSSRVSRTDSLTFGTVSLDSIGDSSPVLIKNLDESTRQALMPGDTLQTSFTIGLVAESQPAWVRFRLYSSIDYITEMNSFIKHIGDADIRNIDTVLNTVEIASIDSIIWEVNKTNGVIDFARIGTITTSNGASTPTLTTYSIFYNDLATTKTAVVTSITQDTIEITPTKNDTLFNDIVAIFTRLNNMASSIISINQAIINNDNFGSGSSSLTGNFFASGNDGYIYRYYSMGRDDIEAIYNPPLIDIGGGVYPEIVRSIGLIYDYIIPVSTNNSLQGVQITYLLSVEAVQYANNNSGNTEFNNATPTFPLPIITGSNATMITEAIKAFYLVAEANPDQITPIDEIQFNLIE